MIPITLLSRPGDACITLTQNYSSVLSSDQSVRPVLMHYFVKMAFSYRDQNYEHILVYVSWLKEHHARKSYGKPLELWWKDLYEANMSSIIPNCSCVPSKINVLYLPCIHRSHGKYQLPCSTL